MEKTVWLGLLWLAQAPAWAGSPVCATTQVVKQAGGGNCASLQQCVNNIPTTPLSGNWCIDVQDSATYSEQVTVSGKNTNGFQIIIGTTTGSAQPVVAPPTGSTAAFQIANSSVSLFNLNVQPTVGVAYGIVASSPNVTLSSVNIQDPVGRILTAGIAISSSSGVSYSSVTVNDAEGLWLTGQFGAVSLSSLTTTGGGVAALYVTGTSNTVTQSYFYNSSGFAALLNNNANGNTVSLSTAATSTANQEAAFKLNGASSNTIAQTFISNPICQSGKSALELNQSNNNTISSSTLSSSNYTINLIGSSNNLFTGDLLQQSGCARTANLLSSHFNTITLSQLQSTGVAQTSVVIQSSSGTVIDQSVLSAATDVLSISGGALSTISRSTITSYLTPGTGVSLNSTSSSTIIGSYVQSSTAVFVGASTATAISSSTLVAVTYTALALSGSSGGAISQSTISANGSAPALLLHAASSNTITQASIANPAGTGVQLDSFASYNTLTLSTVTSGVNADPAGAIYMASASYNTIAQDYLANSSGHALEMESGSNFNAISGSTMTSSSLSFSAAQALGSSNNLFTQDLFFSATWHGLHLKNGANLNTVSQSTVSSNASTSAFFLSSASSNIITGVYVYNGNSAAGSQAGNFDASSAYNSVVQSTFVALTTDPNTPALLLNGSHNVLSNSLFWAAAPGAFPLGAIYLNGGSNNAITASQLVGNVFGTALFLNNSASSNTFTGSAIQGNVFVEYFCTNNVFSQSTITTTGDPAVDIEQASNYATTITGTTINACKRGVLAWRGALSPVITGSTVTVSGACGGYNAIELTQVSSPTIVGSYIRGSTAVFVSGSTGTTVGANTLVATTGSGLWLNNQGNVNLSLSTNVIFGGSSGAGIYLDAGNRGSIWITSNTVIPALAGASNTYGLYLNGLASGATIESNGVYYRAPGSMGASTAYGLFAQNSAGLQVDHNRIDDPGMVTGGSFVGASFTGATNATFKFNDVSSTGTSLSNGYLLQLAGSTVVVKNDVFFSSFGVTGSSATIFADAASGLVSDYNDFFSSNSANTLIWGGQGYQFSTGWAGQDANSQAANPLWFNPSAGVEDFHPASRAGRYSPASQSFVVDCANSLTIDRADPTEAFSLEPAPNGGRANQGSYGDTAQASETFVPAPPASIGATALVGQITLSWTAPNMGSCPSYVDHYSLDYSSVSSVGPFASLGSVSSTTFVFLHTGLNASTTYYYQVFTLDSLGDQSSPAQAFAVTPDTVPPAAVANLAASPGGGLGQANLSWTFPGDDNGATTLPAGSQYAVQYTTDNVGVVWSTASAQVAISTGGVAVGAAQAAVLSSLGQSTTYYFRLWTAHPGLVWSAPSNVALSFSRQAGPALIAANPGAGSTCVAWSTAAFLAFSKPVQPASVASALALTLVQDNLGRSTSAVVVGTLSPATASSTFTFTPSATLPSNGTYVLSLSTAVLDLAGNPLAQATSAQFVTQLDTSVPNVVGLPGLGVNVTVPAGALSAVGCIVPSTSALSTNLAAANQKLLSNSGDPFRFPIAGTIVDLKAYDGGGNALNAFSSPLIVSIPYVDANNDGVVDGTNPPVLASTLGVWWLDDASALWVRLPSSSVNATAKVVTAQTPHFTTFALIGQSASDASGAFAYPVPFKPSLGHTAIHFSGLPQLATIKIFTVSGKLVQTLSAVAAAGMLDWDARNSAGQDVASGVYLYEVKSDSDKKIGKLVIAR